MTEPSRAEEFAALPTEAQDRLLDIYEIALLITTRERAVAVDTFGGVMTAVALLGEDNGIPIGRLMERLIDVLAVAHRDSSRAQAQADRERFIRERNADGRS